MTALTTRFLHTSDLQLGMTRWFLQETEDAQALFDAARVEAITRLGEKAIEYQCDFIIVAGDVFEHNSISTKTGSVPLPPWRPSPSTCTCSPVTTIR